MQAFAYHVFVCEQRKPEGVPCCSARGSAAVLEALRRETAARGLQDTVMVTSCGSLGLCERGPNMVVYPEGVWYSGVTERDVPEIVGSHFVQGVPVQRLMNANEDEVKAETGLNRNRYLQSVQAREAAGALPEEFEQTARAFQESRVVLSAIELDAFTAVGKGATATGAAARMGTNPRATAMLLNALVSMGLLEKSGETFRTTAMADRHLVAGAPFDARAALRHQVSLWQTWSGLSEAVLTGTAPVHRDLSKHDESWTEPFIAAMHRNAQGIAPQVVAAVDPGGARRMLDVGGGSGAWSIAFAQAVPELHVDLMDLAPAVPIAQRHIDEAGLRGRISTRVGDFLRDSLGTGYDLVFLSSICHMLPPSGNRELLRRCFDATAPGGRIVIRDFVLDPSRTAPRFAALFALNMLVGTPAGDSYTEAEYSEWLREAGYADARRIRLPGPAHLMVGRKE